MQNPFEIMLTEIREMKEIIGILRTSPQQQIEIIDRPELLKRLSITEPTAITWGKRGKIPEIRIGSNVRYNWPAVVTSLEKQGK